MCCEMITTISLLNIHNHIVTIFFFCFHWQLNYIYLSFQWWCVSLGLSSSKRNVEGSDIYCFKVWFINIFHIPSLLFHCLLVTMKIQDELESNGSNVSIFILEWLWAHPEFHLPAANDIQICTNRKMICYCITRFISYSIIISINMKRIETNIGIPHFIAFCCTVFHRYCFFFLQKLKVGGNPGVKLALFSQQHLLASCLCVTFW